MKQRALSSSRAVLAASLLAGIGLAACDSHKPAPAPTPTAAPANDATAGGSAAPAAAPAPTAAPKQQGVYVGDLDRSVDPCTDFYEFSNGTWRKQNPIPPEVQKWSRRWKAGEDAKTQLKDLLEPIAARTDWPQGSAEQLIGDLYTGCMDQAKIDQRGLEPFKPMLADIDQMKTVADLGKVLAELKLLGVDAPFRYVSTQDNHAPRNIIGEVQAAGLGLPDRDYYVKTEPRFVEARDKYLAHVTQTFVLAGRSPDAAKAAAGVVIKLETQLAKASLDNVALRDPAATDHATPIADLQKVTPSLDWAAFFTAVGTTPQKLNVTEPKFFEEVQRRLTQTSIADWKTYLSWQLLAALSPYASQPFVDEDFAFNGKYLNGTPENKPRWKRCVEFTDAVLGDALGKKYVEKYFPPAAKARMQQLVKNLLAAMTDSINQLDWMSAETKQRALQKVATFNPKVGYPNHWKDYSGLTIHRDQFAESLMAGVRWAVAFDQGRINKPVDPDFWGITAPTSDAYYNPLQNEIVFPAGILQPPAFSLDYADAINYGAIGVVIGHEISHGFDDQGSQYDDQGRLQNWWTKDDRAKFDTRGKCVVDQFEHYFIEPGIHHTGKLVLGESIGDLGGVNIAYRALQKAKQQSPQPTIDGFTPDQQFYIAWGQFRGDEIQPATQRKMVQGDPHPISKYRVIGPLSNVHEFATAFQCKPDAAMVRPDNQRCQIW